MRQYDRDRIWFRGWIGLGRCIRYLWPDVEPSPEEPWPGPPNRLSGTAQTDKAWRPRGWHSLATGTVTFLFTDIEGSTMLLQAPRRPPITGGCKPWRFATPVGVEEEFLLHPWAPPITIDDRHMTVGSYVVFAFAGA